tara:strand:+ start:1955 stop:2701 length:747 start_codon:yes stop_codon:yes gene_type:complete
MKNYALMGFAAIVAGTAMSVGFSESAEAQACPRDPSTGMPINCNTGDGGINIENGQQQGQAQQQGIDQSFLVLPGMGNHGSTALDMTEIDFTKVCMIPDQEVRRRGLYLINWENSESTVRPCNAEELADWNASLLSASEIRQTEDDRVSLNDAVVAAVANGHENATCSVLRERFGENACGAAAQAPQPAPVSAPAPYVARDTVDDAIINGSSAPTPLSERSCSDMDPSEDKDVAAEVGARCDRPAPRL